MHTRQSLLVLGLMALVTAGSFASAYVFYLTPSEQPLRWKQDTTTLRLSTVAAGELSMQDIEAATDEALSTWADSGCGPRVTRDGTTDATEAQLPPSIRGPADNVIVFIPDAAHWSARNHGTLEIAVTVIANNPATGEIVDADIEVNDAAFKFSVGAIPGPGQVDFRSTLIHEIGHFYGLDHSLARDATMFASYDTDNPVAKRTLTNDDIDGVCALYAVPFPVEDDGCAAGGTSGMLLTILAALVWCLRRAHDETTERRPA